MFTKLSNYMKQLCGFANIQETDSNHSIEDSSKSESAEKHRLSLCVRVIYGFGNVLNDLCATLWFTYLLVYLNYVAELDNAHSGYLMLAGQIADAVSTILAGFLTDRTCTSRRYGRRKTWHLIGCLIVTCFFPFLLNKCIFCPSSSESATSGDWLRFSYYLAFIVIFQFGWATNQVAHLALIPELANEQSARVGLCSVRHAFTVISSVAIYGVAYLLLQLNDSDSTDQTLSPSYQQIFTILSLTAVGAGFLFTVIFHMVIKETRDHHVTKHVIDSEKDCKTDIKACAENKGITWKLWLKEYQLYQICIIYTATRIAVVSSQVYIPFYVSSSLKMPQQFIAIIPLVVYGSSFLTALVMKRANKVLGRKLTYVIGSVALLGSCIWMWFITENSSYQVIGAAILLGSGTSTMYVTALAIVADLIGEHTDTGGFVYGLMSFIEKLLNGGVVALIQFFYPCGSALCCGACVLFYKTVVVFVPGGVTIIALLALATLLPITIGQLRYQSNSSKQKDSTVQTIAIEPYNT